MKIRLSILVSFVLFLLSCNAQTEEKAETANKNESSAATNVKVIDKAFTMQELDREGQIRVYLPPNYSEREINYPVLYMHDGQNLFDDLTSYVGEWGVDETLNELSKKENFNIIVVGVDNGQEKRMNEMAPWDNDKFGKAEGDAYIDFIIHLVKPFVDSTYRTKSDRENTAMMGSSMGGLISHYAIYKHPDIFSKAGIFSPSYWFSDQIFEFTESNALPQDAKIYINVGGKEGSNMVKPAKQMASLIASTGHPSENLYFENVKNGFHGEGFWKAEFGKAVIWLFE